jgi:hypothetical protein
MNAVIIPILLTTLTLALSPVGTARAGQELVSLTMVERAGVERQAEWVTIGVPLPKGCVRSVDDLSLLQDGHPISAEILPVNRWWEDGTLRWVHLIFPADCPANGKASVSLALGKAAAKQAETLRVTESDGGFLVDTGPLVFAVRKKGFNLIDMAQVNGQTIVRSHGRGLGVSVGSNEYLASSDPNARVILEEKGPLHGVIHATGSFRNAAGERRFDFDCRLYAYAGCPYVETIVTLINRQGQEPDKIALDGFFLELPTAMKQGTCTFGTEDGRVNQGSLAEKSEAYIFQSSSSEHVFGGAVIGRGGGKQTKPTSIGWGSLSDGTKGVAAGVKWFWQLHPKSIEVNAEGRLYVGLYPARCSKPLDIYTGVARTHEVRLLFHAGPPDTKKLQSIFAGLQRPLRPFAPPKWYCRDTQCLGDYCEAGGPELYGPFAEKVARFDAAFEQANRRNEAFHDSRTLKGVETDSYGFLGYGDSVHYVWTPNVNVPENIAWDGNYYGYPHMMCVQFLRTGNLEYFDNFEAHALHVADVHVVHYTPRTHLIGGCRYCPPTDHVRIDPTNSNDYRTAKVYVSDLFNHHKVAEIIERWCFLRDHRSRDVAQTVLDYCYRWTYADNDYGQPRGPGTIMDFCYQGYMLTGERKWIDRAAHVLQVHRGRDLNLSFQAGIFLEGMRRYYEMSGNEEAFNYIRQSCDRLIAGNKKGGVTAQAHSFMYLKTGDSKYLQAALDNLPQQGQFGNPGKDFALSMRNAAMCIGDLRRIAQKQTATKEAP